MSEDEGWSLVPEPRSHPQRVDKTAPDTPVTEMTWAEIQKFTTIGEPS